MAEDWVQQDVYVDIYTSPNRRPRTPGAVEGTSIRADTEATETFDIAITGIPTVCEAGTEEPIIRVELKINVSITYDITRRAEAANIPLMESANGTQTTQITVTRVEPGQGEQKKQSHGQQGQDEQPQHQQLVLRGGRKRSNPIEATD